jgi:hypothetical protein
MLLANERKWLAAENSMHAYDRSSAPRMPERVLGAFTNVSVTKSCQGTLTA